MSEVLKLPAGPEPSPKTSSDRVTSAKKITGICVLTAIGWLLKDYYYLDSTVDVRFHYTNPSPIPAPNMAYTKCMEETLPWGEWGQGMTNIYASTLSEVTVKDGVLRFSIFSKQADGSPVPNNFGDEYNVFVRKWGTEEGHPMVFGHGNIRDNFDSSYSVTAPAPFVGEYTITVELSSTACDGVREEGERFFFARINEWTATKSRC